MANIRRSRDHAKLPVDAAADVAIGVGVAKDSQA